MEASFLTIRSHKSTATSRKSTDSVTPYINPERDNKRLFCVQRLPHGSYEVATESLGAPAPLRMLHRQALTDEIGLVVSDRTSAQSAVDELELTEGPITNWRWPMEILATRTGTK